MAIAAELMQSNQRGATVNTKFQRLLKMTCDRLQHYEHTQSYQVDTTWINEDMTKIEAMAHRLLKDVVDSEVYDRSAQLGKEVATIFLFFDVGRTRTTRRNRTLSITAVAEETSATFEYLKSFELLAARFAEACSCHMGRAVSFVDRPIQSEDGHLSAKSSFTMFGWNMRRFFVSVANLLEWQTQSDKLSGLNTRAQFIQSLRPTTNLDSIVKPTKMAGK